MKIYKLDFDVDNYRGVELCEDVDADYYQMFDGRSLKINWNPLQIKEYDEDKELMVGDAPGFHIPLLNKKALDALLPLISNDVEILEYKLCHDIYYGVNVITILDAVNYELSEYKTFRDGKRIMAFKKYVFKDEVIRNKNIFKLVDLPRGDIFVSEQFYYEVLNMGLKGFKLDLVYERI